MSLALKLLDFSDYSITLDLKFNDLANKLEIKKQICILVTPKCIFW